MKLGFVSDSLGGLSFEGLNNAGTLKRQLLVILNDKGMSISKPQGAISQYLERVRVSTTYEEFKRLVAESGFNIFDQFGRMLPAALRRFAETPN